MVQDIDAHKRQIAQEREKSDFTIEGLQEELTRCKEINKKLTIDIR